MRRVKGHDMALVKASRRIAAISLMALSLDTLGVALAQESEISIPNQDRNRWSFHGYFSEAFAISDGNQILGITDEGTFDYRTLALQATFTATSKDRFVVQLQHEHLGDSPLNDLRDAAEIDWMFYERQLPAKTSLKVGRVPMPIGIFNSLRDVGTLLPFFTPPVSMYQDGQFTNETLDGLLLTKDFDKGAWEVDASVYYGEFELAQSLPNRVGLQVGTADARDLLGTQVWINTPLSGLRVGLAYNQHRVVNGIVQLEHSDDWWSSFFSIDANFDRFYARMEMCHHDTPVGPIPDLEFDCLYIQTGVKLSDKVQLNLQYDSQDLIPNSPFLPRRTVGIWRDTAVSLAYSVKVNLVVKAEYHFNEGFLTDDLARSVLVDEPVETKFGILSLAYSF